MSVLPAIRSESRKIVTIRSPWVLLAAGPLIVLAGVSGVAETNPNFSNPATQSTALAHIGIAALMSLILGILGTAGEYRYGGSTDTFLSFPQRGRVLITKFSVYALVGAVAGIASAVVAVAATAAWAASRGGSFQPWQDGAWRTIVGGIAVNIVFAAMGAAIGALVRNVVIAIAVALAWIAGIEGIAGQLIGSDLARWLPYTASQSLDRSDLFANGSLSQWSGGLVLLGYAAVIAAAAAITTLKRDVA